MGLCLYTPLHVLIGGFVNAGQIDPADTDCIQKQVDNSGVKVFCMNLSRQVWDHTIISVLQALGNVPDMNVTHKETLCCHNGWLLVTRSVATFLIIILSVCRDKIIPRREQDENPGTFTGIWVRAGLNSVMSFFTQKPRMGLLTVP